MIERTKKPSVNEVVSFLSKPNPSFKTDDWGSWYLFKLKYAILKYTSELYVALPDDYHDFLKTPYWKIVASWVKKRYKNRCALCNSPHKLVVHHRQYLNHCREHLHWKYDLVALCSGCHFRYHYPNGK